VGARQRAQRDAHLVDEMGQSEVLRAATDAAVAAKITSSDISGATADVDALLDQARNLQEQNNLALAVAAAARAEATCRQLLPNDLLRLVRVRAFLASSLALLGRPDGIQPLQEGIARLVAAVGKDNVYVWLDEQALALALVAVRRKDEGGALYESIAADTSRVLGKDSPFALIARINVIRWYTQVGKSRQAIALGRQAIEPCQKTFGPHSSFCVSLLFSLGIAQLQEGNLAAARAATTKALVEDVRLNGLGGSNMIVSQHYAPAQERTEALQELSLLAHIDLGPGKHDEVKQYETVLRERERVLGSNAMPTLRFALEVAAVELRAGRYDAASRRFFDVHRRVDATYGAYSPLANEVAMAVATQLVAAGRFKEIEPLVEETRARVWATVGSRSEMGVLARFNEGLVKARLGQPDAAGILAEAVASAEATLDPASPVVAAMRQQVGMLSHP
jgi:hypothetical protein